MSNSTEAAFADVTVSGSHQAATIPAIVMLSSLFFIIGIVGVIGNFLVIFVVLSDKRMRSSVTNLLIMNLAISDFVIMVVCVPDIVLFMMNSGWQLGLSMCRMLRFLQVASLYASVMTLVSVCIERYIAIVHPIKAHIMCCRARILIIIVCIWPVAMTIASPQIMYNVISQVQPNFTPCITNFPSVTAETAFYYSEFTVFYLIPLVIQITLYVRIGQRLFNTDALKRIEPVSGKQRFSNAMRSRKGVVKMLIAGVVVYFICFSPHQVLLLYRSLSSNMPFEDTWSLLVFTKLMAYASSASNPLLYSVFSNKFRRKLGHTLCCRQATLVIKAYPISVNNVASPHNLRRTFRIKSFRTTISEV